MTALIDYIKPDSKIACPRCKELKLTMVEWPGPCKDCKKDKVYIKEQEEKRKELDKKNKGPNTFTGKKVASDITHFVKDEAGKSWGVDVHGKLHAQSETRYNINNDRNGWKAVGIEPKDGFKH